MSIRMRMRGSSGLDGLPDVIVGQVKEYIATSTHGIRTEYRAKVPVDEGDLQNSIDESFSASGLSSTVGSSGVPHAVHVEFGTDDTPAFPALFPAFQSNVRKLRKNLRGLVKDLGPKLRTRVRRSNRTRA